MGNGFGKYDVYTTSESIYCYRGTDVLINRFGIRDGEKLKALEADISAARQVDLLNHPVSGRFSSSHLCRIHRALFGDIYPFAGHFRREDIMKGATRFLHWADIDSQLKGLLSDLHKEKFLVDLPGTAYPMS